MKTNVNRYQIAAASCELEKVCSMMDSLISELTRSAQMVNYLNQAKELEMFAEIFNGSAVKRLEGLKSGIQHWAIILDSISQTYLTVQRECYRKILNC